MYQKGVYVEECGSYPQDTVPVSLLLTFLLTLNENNKSNKTIGTITFWLYREIVSFCLNPIQNK